MTDSEHDKLEQLFSAALEKESNTERQAFLDGACAEDTDLRAQVEKLLKAHGSIGAFLDSPPVDPDATLEASAPGQARQTKLGRYRILQELGVEMEELTSTATRIASEPTEPQPGESAISKYGRDLTAEARMGMLDPVIGRDKELKSICRILSRKKKNNPALVGEAGVGKTAIVEGLALKVVNKEPDVKLLWGKRIVAIEISRLTAGTGMRGSFEERLANIIGEAQSDGNTILFVDELHTIMNAGKTEGSAGASDALKPALQSGLGMIGATTLLEYRELEKDGAFERRFADVRVEEPSVEEAVQIVTQAIGGYCIKHCVHYPGDVLRAAVELSHQYIKDRRLPDKAFTLLDDAGVNASSQPEKTVTRSMIEELITQERGVPIETSEEEADRLQRMEEIIAQRVIGHEDTIREICDTVRTRRAGTRSIGATTGRRSRTGNGPPRSIPTSSRPSSPCAPCGPPRRRTPS